jgi:hypothetical protein
MDQAQKNIWASVLRGREAELWESYMYSSVGGYCVGDLEGPRPCIRLQSEPQIDNWPRYKRCEEYLYLHIENYLTFDFQLSNQGRSPR